MKLNIQLFADGSVTIDMELITTKFDARIKKTEQELEDLYAVYNKALNNKDHKYALSEQELEDLEFQIEKTEEKYVRLIEKQDALNKKGGHMDNVKNSLGDIIKKVGKWTIAIFGVRSAYSFVRQAISSISQYNKNLAKDIENIKYSMSNALAPIILKIVTWVQRLIQMINYIWRKVFGKNLFEDIPNNLKAGNKEAKKLQKTIAGFDEMNVLSDSSSGGGGGIGGGTTTHSLTGTDLISPETFNLLDKIAEKLGIFGKNEDEAIDKTDQLAMLLGGLGVGAFFLTFFKLLKGHGLEAFGMAIEKIRNGVDLLSAKLGVDAPLVGGLMLLDAILLIIIAKMVYDLIPVIKETHKLMDDTNKHLEENTKKTKEANKTILEYAENVDNTDKELNDYTQRLLDSAKGESALIDKHKEDISVTGALTGENKVHKKAIEELDAQMWSEIKTLGQLASSNKLTKEQAQQFVDVCQDEIYKLEEQNQKLNKNSEEYKKNKERIEELKKQIDLTKGNYDVNVRTKADKKPIDEMKKSADDLDGEYKVDFTADTKKANSKVAGWLSSLSSVGILGNFIKTGMSLSQALKKFPHAKGGIINQPGRGVPLHIGGEAGKEGIVPLTDSQQMQLLGEAIGKYVTINASITNTMNGRVISRELQKINNENNFAGNR